MESQSQQQVPAKWSESASGPPQPKCADFDVYFHKYNRIVSGSEGFVAYLEKNSDLVGGTRPYCVTEEVEEAARFAIEEYNTWGADLVLKRVVKVNVQPLSGLAYYITLEATCSYGGESAFYETKVITSTELPLSFKLFVFRRAIFYNLQEDVKSNHGSCTREDDTSSKRMKALSQGLMSYTQFIEELEDDVLPDEAGKRYKEYTSEYISTQKRSFFHAHKDEEWLKDRYHPTNLLAVVERRNECARRVAHDFRIALLTETLDLTCCAIPLSASKSGQPNSDDEPYTICKWRQHGICRAEEANFPVVLKAHPVTTQPRRIQADIRQVHDLIHKFDIEKGFETDYFGWYASYSEGLGEIENLDILLSYLWHIHSVNYYGMIERNEPKGFRHLRPNGDGKNHGENEESGAGWEKKLDSFWRNRLRDQDPLQALSSKEKIDAAADIGPYLSKMRDDEYEWKYGYGGGATDCTKRFHAAEFMCQHLKDLPTKYVRKVTSDALEHVYFHNYMSDPDAPSGTPVLQQPQIHEREEDEENELEERDSKKAKLSESIGEELDIAFSVSDVKNKYKDAALLPNWKAFRTTIFLERDDGLHDSSKIAAFDFDGCLAKTSVTRRGPDAWSLMFPSIPDKLQSLYNDGYKLVIFTNESNIERWKNKRQAAVDSKIGRLNNFIKEVKVPIQVFIACGISKPGGQAEDPFRKPKPGMWHLMEQHFNSGIPIDKDQSFYVGDAAGRDNDHSDADIKFAQAVGLEFHVPEEYFGM